MHRQEQLIVLIDRALDDKDENAFYQYATELNSLHQTEDESY
ncbi:IDEAL domain-containing protein [Lysinibacillus sp. MHQ-1]|nr:IDEAL domain-containing protein [Lysinibacillus sp. MHQ-1]